MDYIFKNLLVTLVFITFGLPLSSNAQNPEAQNFEFSGSFDSLVTLTQYAAGNTAYTDDYQVLLNAKFENFYGTGLVFELTSSSPLSDTLTVVSDDTVNQTLKIYNNKNFIFTATKSYNSLEFYADRSLSRYSFEFSEFSNSSKVIQLSWQDNSVTDGELYGNELLYAYTDSTRDFLNSNYFSGETSSSLHYLHAYNSPIFEGDNISRVNYGGATAGRTGGQPVHLIRGSLAHNGYFSSRLQYGLSRESGDREWGIRIDSTRKLNLSFSSSKTGSNIRSKAFSLQYRANGWAFNYGFADRSDQDRAVDQVALSTYLGAVQLVFDWSKTRSSNSTVSASTISSFQGIRAAYQGNINFISAQFADVKQIGGTDTSYLLLGWTHSFTPNASWTAQYQKYFNAQNGAISEKLWLRAKYDF